MITLTQPERYTATNAWGRDVTATRQRLRIEPSDVGRAEHHYRGFCHATHVFVPSDVGRTITRVTSPTEDAYVFWTFD